LVPLARASRPVAFTRCRANPELEVPGTFSAPAFRALSRPALPLEPQRHQVHLGAFFAAGGGFGVADAVEAAFDLLQEFALGAALEDLADEGAAGGEHFLGEHPGGLGETHDAQVV